LEILPARPLVAVPFSTETVTVDGVTAVVRLGRVVDVLGALLVADARLEFGLPPLPVK
jgi:hypothetical protein